MRIVITAKSLPGKLAMQKHLDTKLNLHQRLLKKQLFSEEVIQEPYFQIIIGFKKAAFSLIRNVDDFVEKIHEALKENGAGEDDYSVEVERGDSF